MINLNYGDFDKKFFENLKSCLLALGSVTPLLIPNVNIFRREISDNSERKRIERIDVVAGGGCAPGPSPSRGGSAQGPPAGCGGAPHPGQLCAAELATLAVGGGAGRFRRR
jgi:hypothetical protein